MTPPRLLLVDTDTASDDAVALLMALRHPGVEVLALTVVAGNVPLDQGVQNALYTRDLVGSQVPVHAGCAAPLLQPLHTAQHVHGSDGMGDIGLDLRGRAPAPDHAVDVLVETILAHPPGAITLVTLGPLTNVAVALAREPAIARRLERIVVMGGTGDGVGNMSAVAEFHVWADPEAAAFVLACDAQVTMVGWDISRTYAAFDREDAATVRALGPLGAFSVDIQATLDRYALEETHLAGFDLPDPIAMAVALDDTVATRTEHLNVVVETRGEHTRGETVVDHLGITKRAPNVHVVLEASRERFLAVLHAALTS